MRTLATALLVGPCGCGGACIAGGISGAFNGVGGIPVRWRDGVEGADRLRDLAGRLA